MGSRTIAWKSLEDTFSIEQVPVHLTELDGDPVIPSPATAGDCGATADPLNGRFLPIPFCADR
jgi:hypothetical protein